MYQKLSTVFSVLLCSLMLSSSQVAFAQNDELALIRVSAEGSVKAQPDQASLSVRFNDTKFDASEARKVVDKQVSTLLKGLKKFSLKENSLDSSQTNINPQYRYHKNERQFTGYQVERNVQFVLSDLSQLEALLSTITGSKAAQLGHISFGLANEGLVRQQALSKAIAKSKQVARHIAKDYGVSLGKIHSVNYQNVGAYQPRAVMMKAMGAELMSADAPSSYEQKDLEFKASVNTAFTFK